MSDDIRRTEGIILDSDGTPIWLGTVSGTPSSDQSGGKAMVQIAVEADATAGPILRVSLDSGSTWAGVDPQVRNQTSTANGSALPGKFGGSVAVTTAGAETRTLAAPGYVGQTLSIYFQTDGGDCVITSSAAINQTGNNTITLDDAGDCITLRGVFTGAAMVWRVLASDGPTLSTV